MRILLGAHGGIGDANVTKHLDGFVPRFAARRFRVNAHDFRDLIAHRKYGVQRGHRFLKNHRHAVAANGAQFFVRKREEIEAVKPDGAPGFNAAGRRHKPQ